MTEARPVQVLYLAHDLDDSAIWRRCEMLRAGGAEVRLAGFRRGDGPLAGPAVVLGRTQNGRMAGRAMAVLRKLTGLAARLGPGLEPDVILARNLEMLALAVSLRRQFPRARIVYELLDIHRLLLGAGIASRALRAVEAGLMRQAELVIVSSPGFVRNYLTPFDRPARAVALVENKPMAVVGPVTRTPAAGPVRIGWFGILRCVWSLEMLDRLTRAEPGRWQVVLRGKPALDVVPGFHALVNANPDLEYLGPYRPDELGEIYAGVDLSWLIDRYEAGGNSDWLLPNRLYEGCLHGAVPLALAGTETAARLTALGIGVIAKAPDAAAVNEALGGVSRETMASLKGTLLELPRETWVAGPEDCRMLVERLRTARSADSVGMEVLA